MDLQTVLYETEDTIATITLNRPERLNAYGGTMGPDLLAALEEAESDAGVRAIILTGAERAFSSGLDLKERAEGTRTMRVDYLVGSNLAKRVLRMNKPIIAAVHGPAVGWGFELALLCDYRIGSEQARMGDVHTSLGIVQDNGAQYTLPRLVGWANACEILLTGELFDAERLRELGVLQKVVPAENLMDAARDFARRIVRNAPMAVQMSKRLMRMSLQSDMEDSMDYSMLMMGAMMKSEDSQEGFRAFAEKRTPEFKGR